MPHWTPGLKGLSGSPFTVPTLQISVTRVGVRWWRFIRMLFFRTTPFSCGFPLTQEVFQSWLLRLPHQVGDACAFTHWIIFPYHAIEVDGIHIGGRVARFLKPPSFWDPAEFCRGIFVDLPLVITYVGSHLIHHPSWDLWVLLLTYLVSKVSEFVL